MTMCEKEGDEHVSLFRRTVSERRSFNSTEEGGKKNSPSSEEKEETFIINSN